MHEDRDTGAKAVVRAEIQGSLGEGRIRQKHEKWAKCTKTGTRVQRQRWGPKFKAPERRIRQKHKKYRTQTSTSGACAISTPHGAAATARLLSPHRTALQVQW